MIATAPMLTIGAPTRGGYPVTRLGETRVLPRVTAILQAWPKPWGIPWAAKEERALLKEATWDLIRTVRIPEAVGDFDTWSAMVEKFAGEKKAHRKKLVEAGEIGTLAHARIQHATNVALGKRSDFRAPECSCTDGKCRACASLLAFMAWEDWARSVEWKPLDCEFRVASWPAYAGTVDALGYVRDVLTLVDYKTAKGIYAEAVAQVAAYVNALPESIGREPDSAVILRLPKTMDDPGFEALPLDGDELAVGAAGFLAAYGMHEFAARVEKIARREG